MLLIPVSSPPNLWNSCSYRIIPVMVN